MNTATSPSKDELEILHLVDQWKRALCARDLDSLMQHYAPGVVFFDAVPPHEHHGAEAYHRTWEAMFDFLPPHLASETRDMVIKTSGDLAVMHCLQRLVNADTGEAATCGWVRVTVGYERQQGTWRVVHEHVSVPFDPATSKAAFAPDA